MDNALVEQIINEAKTWKGTRWIHRQSVKGVGTDCVQYLIAIGKSIGKVPQNYKTPHYNRSFALHDNSDILLREIRKFCRLVPRDELDRADIMIFTFGKTASHAGVYIGNGRMIHAYLRSGCIEDEINRYTDRLHSVWRIKE